MADNIFKSCLSNCCGNLIAMAMFIISCAIIVSLLQLGPSLFFLILLAMLVWWLIDYNKQKKLKEEQLRIDRINDEKNRRNYQNSIQGARNIQESIKSSSSKGNESTKASLEDRDTLKVLQAELKESLKKLKE
ncbi:MAG: hypothetical protein AB8E87_05460 [Prochlorococcus sp.]